MKKRATKAERDHMGSVAELGCMICKMPAECHHIGNQGVKASNYEVIPLCPLHHRHGNVGVAVHSGRRSWEANFGTERDMLKRVLEGLLVVK